MVNYYPYFLCLLVSIHLLPIRSDGTVTKNYLSGQELPFTVEFQVVLPTGQSSFYVNVVPSWAPMAARRFRELIKERFYDNTRFHLVIPGSIVQFGISNNPKSNRRWSNRGMHDEIQVAVKNIRGRISFVKSDRPHSRRFQLFINCADNSKLDGMGYAPFGEVHGGENGSECMFFFLIFTSYEARLFLRFNSIQNTY